MTSGIIVNMKGIILRIFKLGTEGEQLLHGFPYVPILKIVDKDNRKIISSAYSG